MSLNPARRAVLPTVFFALFFWLAPCPAAETNAAPAPGEPKVQHVPKLVSDEPNTLGVAEDSYDGHPYMDFNISVRHPISYGTRVEGRTRYAGTWMPYLSFTARASQYFTRRSAPVVTKRFNPKLIVRVYQSEPPEGKRIWVDDSALDYYDFGYAHESNGQYVNSAAAFDAVATNFGSTNAAQDYIHRGWDYVDFRRHSHWRVDRRASLDIELKYFLNRGLLQHDITEIYPWEVQPSVTHIRQVDGIRVTAGFELGEDWFKNARLSWITGYRQVAHYNTVRIESTFVPLSHYLGVPIILWAQSGYNSSVARFYQRSSYVGMAFSFATEQ